MARRSISRLGVDNARSQTRLVRRLKEIRKAQGLSAIAIAESMGVDESMIYRFEKGGTNFTMSTLRKYAKAVGASLQLDATPLSAPAKEIVISVRKPTTSSPYVFEITSPPAKASPPASWTTSIFNEPEGHHPQSFTIEGLSMRPSRPSSLEAEPHT